MATLTQQQVNTLQKVCYTTETEARAYSGRAMYGDICLGIVFHNGAGDLFALALELQRQDPDLAELLDSSPCRTDSMGRGEVIYWERLKLDGTDLDEEGDED